MPATSLHMRIIIIMENHILDDHDHTDDNESNNGGLEKGQRDVALELAASTILCLKNLIPDIVCSSCSGNPPPLTPCFLPIFPFYPPHPFVPFTETEELSKKWCIRSCNKVTPIWSPGSPTDPSDRREAWQDHLSFDQITTLAYFWLFLSGVNLAPAFVGVRTNGASPSSGKGKQRGQESRQ